MRVLWSAARFVKGLHGDRHAAKSAPAGFTLLEVLISLVIVLLASMALFRGGMDGLRGIAAAGRVQEALVLAQSRLSEFDAAAGPGETAMEGDVGNGLHWALRAVPVGTVPYRPDPGRPLGGTVLFRVSVTVS